MKNNRIRQLEALLTKNNIPIPKENEMSNNISKASNPRGNSADGVELEG